jgi:hypothetical protein
MSSGWRLTTTLIQIRVKHNTKYGGHKEYMVDVGMEKFYQVSKKMYLGKLKRAKIHFLSEPDKPSPSRH